MSYCTNLDTIEKNDIPKTQKAQIAVLTPSVDKDFLVRKIKLKSGFFMPNHTNKIQHQQYVLKGEAKVVIGNEEFHAKECDFYIFLLR